MRKLEVIEVQTRKHREETIKLEASIKKITVRQFLSCRYFLS